MSDKYVKIQSVTVGSGGATSIDFTSIPNNYDDLLVKLSTRTSDSSDGQVVNIAFNNSTSNISARLLYGTGGSAVSGTSTSNVIFTSGNSATASTFGNGEVYFPNYAGSTNKSFSSDSVSENSLNTTAYQVLLAGLWSQTTAINQLTFTPGASANFMQHSTATLYGIKRN